VLEVEDPTEATPKAPAGDGDTDEEHIR
jgi:hypothetical protein